MTCKKVMIVDDDADIRSSLSEALEIEGYEVLLAKDGLDALTVLMNLPAQSLPSFILLDES